MSTEYKYPCVPCIVEGHYDIDNDCGRDEEHECCNYCDSPEDCAEMPTQFHQKADEMLATKHKHIQALNNTVRGRWLREFKKHLSELQEGLKVWFAIELQRRAEVKKRQEEERKKREEEEARRMQEEEAKRLEAQEREEMRRLARLIELTGKYTKTASTMTTYPTPTEIKAPGIEKKLDQLTEVVGVLATALNEQSNALVS